jgi:hypothetical protein
MRDAYVLIVAAAGPCCFSSWHPAGCHVGGGNIVQAGATLFQADLEKNGVADSGSLYQLIYAGKGRMPGFGQDCAPKVRSIVVVQLRYRTVVQVEHTLARTCL